MTEPTHDLGRLLDAVIVPSDFEPAEIKINETCLSDHKMVFWTTQITCPPPEFKTVKQRNWRQFNQEQFTLQLQESELCSPVMPGKTVSELVECYRTVITNILDDLAPETVKRVRVRPYLPLYDEDCQQERRVARRVERVYRKAKGTAKETETLAEWRSAIRCSRRLVKIKGRDH